MTQITREQLFEKRQTLNSELESLKNKKYDYITKDNTFCTFGKIENMGTSAVVMATSEMLNEFKQYDDAIEALGINYEMPKTWCEGFSKEEWLNDFKLRLTQIEDSKRIKKLKEAIKLIDANLSVDDKFKLDMEKVNNLL
ncbi:MAG: hypothetical protein RSE41_00065 [Clostridia bacterium]